QWIAGSSEQDVGVAGRVLQKRKIEERFGRFAQAVVLHVFHHAGNRPLVFPSANVPTDWILSGPETLSHRLIDDADERSVFAVLRGEFTAGKNRDAHQREVVGTDHVQVDQVLLAR